MSGQTFIAKRAQGFNKSTDSALQAVSGIVTIGKDIPRITRKDQNSEIKSPDDVKTVFKRRFNGELSDDASFLLFAINIYARTVGYKHFPMNRELRHALNLTTASITKFTRELIEKDLLFPNSVGGGASNGYIMTKKALNIFLNAEGRKKVNKVLSTAETRLEIMHDIMITLKDSEPGIRLKEILDKVREKRKKLPTSCDRYLRILTRKGFVENEKRLYRLTAQGRRALTPFSLSTRDFMN